MTVLETAASVLAEGMGHDSVAASGRVEELVDAGFFPGPALTSMNFSRLLLVELLAWREVSLEMLEDFAELPLMAFSEGATVSDCENAWQIDGPEFAGLYRTPLEVIESLIADLVDMQRGNEDLFHLETLLLGAAEGKPCAYFRFLGPGGHGVLQFIYAREGAIPHFGAMPELGVVDGMTAGEELIETAARLLLDQRQATVDSLRKQFQLPAVTV